ncbi:MAG: Na/Pi cotransporter family protein, partial [Niameybacter sp.]
VMVVGFVNAGLMSLTQAVGVIMGANVGTTVTAWIVSLGEWTSFLKPSVLAPLCIAIGVGLIMFSKKEKMKHTGAILFGFGTLFLGLDTMSDAAKPLRELEEVKNLFIVLGSNPILGILVGAGVTAIIQSSSASVGILQALALASLVPWNSAIYIILGQNIGTCITAILSSVGANLNAKRAAAIHFMFNMIGSVLFGIVAVILFKFVVPELGAQMIGVTQISVVHTVFNIVNTILLFPFAGTLVYLAEHLVKGKNEAKTGELRHLDERIFETPAFALENVITEVIRMGEMAKVSVEVAIQALFEKNKDKVEQVFETEREINAFQKGLNHYLIKLGNVSLSEDESLGITNLFHIISDIERIGDHADNIAELAQNLIQDETVFSEEARRELLLITQTGINCLEMALEAYVVGDVALARKAVELEDNVDKMEKNMRASHIKRLVQNACEPMAGIVFIDTISNVERISDHASNIAGVVLDENK